MLDKHAPIIEKKIRDSHHQPWLNDKIKSEVVLRRKKERIWLEDQSEYSLNAFYVQCRHAANIIKTAQCNYYKEIIHENCNDYKAIFNIANSLWCRNSDSPMPDIKPLSTLAEGFNEYFYIKIAETMDKFKLKVSTQNPSKYVEDEYQTHKRIGILSPVSHMDVINMVNQFHQNHVNLTPYLQKYLKTTLVPLPME